MTRAFNDIRLEEAPYPQLKADRAVVKTKVVEASATEARLFYGDRSDSYDKLENPLRDLNKFSANIADKLT